MSDLRIPSGTTVPVSGDHHISDRSTSSAPPTSWGARASSLDPETSTEFTIAQEEKGVWGHTQDVIKGGKDAVVDGVQGMWSMIQTGFDLLNPFDRDKQVEAYEGVKTTAKVIWEQPTAVLEAAFDPITRRIKKGKYAEAAGYGVVEVLFFLLGAKGADKVAKGTSIANKVGKARKTASVSNKIDTIADAGKVSKKLDNTAEIGQVATRKIPSRDVPWLSWRQYPKVTFEGKEYVKIGDRLYTRHAIERTYPRALGKAAYINEGRSIAPQFIEEVINSPLTKRKPALGPNKEPRTVFYNGNLKVVTEQSKGKEIVISVVPEKRKR